MASFFNYFPTLNYNKAIVTNIIAKIRFRENVREATTLFYPYTVKEGERPDQIAEHYYGDPHYDWLVYLANDIVDPYHQWPKDQRSLDDYVKAVYGSISAAQNQVRFYRVNYYNDDTLLSLGSYSALSDKQKQYWMPATNLLDQVVGYQRRPLDTVVDTNYCVGLTGTFGTTVDEVTTYAVTTGQRIKQGTAYGTVASVAENYIVVNHIQGNWSSGGTVTDVNTGSTVDITITAANELPGGLSTDERVYWDPITSYEYEQEQNEQKKEIRLIHTAYVNTIEKDMRELLQQ